MTFKNKDILRKKNFKKKHWDKDILDRLGLRDLTHDLGHGLHWFQ
jgi:hypothetical protein